MLFLVYSFWKLLFTSDNEEKLEWSVLKFKGWGIVISWITHTIKTDIKTGCSAGLADIKLSPLIDITLSDTETQKTKVLA